MFCRACQAEKQPAMDFRADGKFVEQCPTCTMPFNVGAHAAPEQVSPATSSAPARPAAKTGEPESGDSLVERLRARLAFVEDEIVARLKYDVERDMLRRMLAIAEPVITEVVAPPLN